MNLLMKKISALSPTELNDLFKPIGTSDLPYPSTHFGFDSNGKLEADIGVIADDAHPLAVYSDRSHEYVVGQLNRRMPIPSLLHVQKMAELEQQLTYAFMLRAGNEAEVQPLVRMMTTRSMPAEAPVYIVSQLG